MIKKGSKHDIIPSHIINKSLIATNAKPKLTQPSLTPIKVRTHETRKMLSEEAVSQREVQLNQIRPPKKFSARDNLQESVQKKINFCPHCKKLLPYIQQYRPRKLLQSIAIQTQFDVHSSRLFTQLQLKLEELAHNSRVQRDLILKKDLQIKQKEKQVQFFKTSLQSLKEKVSANGKNVAYAQLDLRTTLHQLRKQSLLSGKPVQSWLKVLIETVDLT